MRAGRRERRGIALIDLVFLLIAVVLALQLATGVLDYREFRYRDTCFDHQKAIEHLMWDVLAQSNRELPTLSTADILNGADGKHHMILVFLAGPEEKTPSRVVVDLDERSMSALGVCPLHKPAAGTVSIDYWFGAGRWWCLHNPRHN